MKLPLRLLPFVCLGVMTLCVSASAQSAANYDTLVQQGKTRLQSGNNDGALASANAAIKLNANRWEAYVLAGGALMNLKRNEEAADQFGHAIDHAPEVTQAGLRELRRQCLLRESAAPSASTSIPAQTSAPGTGSGPSYGDTVKWIRGNIDQSGFAGGTKTHSQEVDVEADAPYTIKFDGCTMDLGIASHLRSTRPDGSDPEDFVVSFDFYVPLGKVLGISAMPAWSFFGMEGVYGLNDNMTYPAVVIALPDDVGTYSVYSKGYYESSDGVWRNSGPIPAGDPQRGRVWNFPKANNIASQPINKTVAILYGRAGTNDLPAHMAGALKHLAEICKDHPDEVTKPLF